MLGNGKYYVVQDWMLSELGLRGLDLTLYAIIWGFTQDGKSKFYGSLSYLQLWTNATKQGILKSLNKLLELKLVEKQDEIIQGCTKSCKYWCTDPINYLVSKHKTEVEFDSNEHEFEAKNDSNEHEFFEENYADLSENGSKNFTCNDSTKLNGTVRHSLTARLNTVDSHDSTKLNGTVQLSLPNNIVIKNNDKNIDTKNINNQNFYSKNFDENNFSTKTFLNTSTVKIPEGNPEGIYVLEKNSQMRKKGTAFTKLNISDSGANADDKPNDKKVRKVKRPLPSKEEVYNSSTKMSNSYNWEGIAKKEAEKKYKEQKQQIKSQMLQQDACRMIDSMFAYEPLRDKLREYYEIRKDMKLKSKFTLIAWKAILEDLRQQKLTEDEAVAAVTQSIAGGWAQIYYQNKIKSKNSFDNLAGKVRDKAYVEMTDEEKREYDANKAVDENGNPIYF